MLRTPTPPRRTGWRWALLVALVLGFVGTTVVATPTLRPPQLDGVAARLEGVAASLRRTPPPELMAVPGANAAPPLYGLSPGTATPQKADLVSSFGPADAGADAGRREAGKPASDAGVRD
jgi:hypothetical protein